MIETEARKSNHHRRRAPHEAQPSLDQERTTTKSAPRLSTGALCPLQACPPLRLNHNIAPPPPSGAPGHAAAGHSKSSRPCEAETFRGASQLHERETSSLAAPALRRRRGAGWDGMRPRFGGARSRPCHSRDCMGNCPNPKYVGPYIQFCPPPPRPYQKKSMCVVHFHYKKRAKSLPTQQGPGTTMIGNALQRFIILPTLSSMLYYK